MLYPIQPYFVIQSDVYYKRRMQEFGIAHFYRFDYTEHTELGNTVMPDGAVDIIFSNLNGELDAQAYGPVTTSCPSVFVKGGRYFGVRLLPGWFDNFGTVSVREMVAQAAPLSSILLNGNRVVEQIALETDFRQQITHFTRAFAALIDQSDKLRTSGVVRQTLHTVLDSKGQVRVSQLERDLSYSRRHIQRTFSQSMGIGLKQFCRVVRFQNALQAINRQTGCPLSEVAAENGYFDQAHLFKEFREFALTSPRDYQSMLAKVRYKDRIVIS